MIVLRYQIQAATEASGKGVFLLEPAQRGQILVAPDKIDRIYSQSERDAFPDGSPEDTAAARWFESYHTASVDWPDDCYVNHSFEPTGLWHLGFVFANRDLPAGAEITVDYRFVVGDHERLPFRDAATGREIVGLPWSENLRQSTRLLAALLAK